MNPLTIFTLISCFCILVYFLTDKPLRLTYTETMIARKLGSCLLAMLFLLGICLFLLKEMQVLLILAFILNILLSFSMILYFIFIFLKPK